MRSNFKKHKAQDGWFPEHYEARPGQLEFIQEASSTLKRKEVFLGSAPCGIGKSMAALAATLPHLKKSKLLICFRTRNQLHIFLKELKALNRSLTAVSFFSKQKMCPLSLKEDFSYFEFFDECRRLKENCESSIRPNCRFYSALLRGRKEAEKLALNCARQFLTPEDSVRLMAKRGFCAYEALKLILHKADIFLGTYHYVFNPQIRRALLGSLGSHLSASYLIVDEAHNLPAFSRELLSDRLTRTTVERALKETESFDHQTVLQVREYLNVLDDEIFQRAQKQLRKEDLKLLSPEEVSILLADKHGMSVSEAAETLQDYGEYVKERRQELGHDRILSYNQRVGEFVEKFFGKTGTDFIHTVTKDWKDRIVLEVGSLDGREITDSVLRGVQGGILMSGFLSPPKVYRDLLFYEKEAVSFKEFDSPFPPENRLILAAEDVSSKLEKRTHSMMKRWAQYIEAISRANEGNVGVFFTSYGLMHSVRPLVETHREEIVEQRKTKRRHVMHLLSRSDENLLLGVMGGKFSEGIDYPNDLLTCVAAIGLPYSTWNVRQKALISYYDQQFPRKGRVYAYLVPTILKLIQTCGRVHRSADDKGCIAILDERVMHPSIKLRLPNHFQKEMKPVKGPPQAAMQIEGFWAKNRN